VSDDRLLVTGGTGFVGRHVLAALRTDAAQFPIRILAHQATPPPGRTGIYEIVFGDLSDPRSLAHLCDGVDTVLHLACHIADDEARCDAVNGAGTEALVAAAKAAGVRRILYLSNAAVYGYGVHRHATEAEARVAPATPVSRSRARAERAVLAAGGIVLRPLFIYGEGDTRFLPVVIRALQRLPFVINGGHARLSVIAVHDLAKVIATLSRLPWSERDAGAYHLNDTHPVTFHEIMEELARQFDLAIPSLSLPYRVARWPVRLASDRFFGGGGWSDSSAHRLFLVARDHYYDASRLWRLLPIAPGGPFASQLGQSAIWYGQYVQTRSHR
jgi:2-alkyl-3-oxoalkanoate reductase